MKITKEIKKDERKRKRRTCEKEEKTTELTIGR